MTTAGQIDVKLGLNSDEFIKAFSDADDKLKQLEKNLKQSKADFENVSKAMAGAKHPSKDLVNLFNEMKKKLKEDQSALDGFQNKLNSLQGGLIKTNPAVDMLTSGLKKLAGPAAAAMVAKKLVDMGREAVNVAAKFESLAVSFEVLTGGAEAGKRLTDQIIELASKTPLTTEALTDGARTLLNFGESADEVVNDLKLLGDITGGDAQRMQSLTLAFAQVGSTGRLMGQDLLQMVNAGFNPLSIMSEKTGKSMATLKKEMSEGKITFLDVKDAMVAATSEGGRFYGMMDKQSQTLGGRLSTLADTWQLVSKNIGDFFLPAAKAAVGALNAIGEAVLNVQNKLKFKTAQNDVKALNSALTYQQEQLSKARTETERKEWEARIAQTKEYLKIHQSIIDSFDVGANGKVTSKKNSSGFAALSGKGTDNKNKEALKKAKKQKDDLLTISKDYARQMADIESLETAKSDLMSEGGRFQRNYEEKLRILQWYYNERYRIMEVANNDMTLAQEQFNQLEELKNQKLLQANITDWADWENSIKNIAGNAFNSLLTTADNFGNTMMSIMDMVYQSLIRMAFEAAMEEIEIATVKTAIITALNAMTGGIAGAVSNIGGQISGLIGKLPKKHSGGMSTQEQLAVIRKDERVLNPAETASYNAGQGGNNSGGGNNIVLFNIKAWDGKDVINTLKSNSQVINQIVASGIKNNNQGLRTTVQNT